MPDSTPYGLPPGEADTPQVVPPSASNNQSSTGADYGLPPGETTAQYDLPPGESSWLGGMMPSHTPHGAEPPHQNMLYIPGLAAPVPIGNEKWKQYLTAVLNPIQQVPAETVHALSGAVQGIHSFSQKHPIISQVASEMFPGQASMLSPAMQAIQGKTGTISAAKQAGDISGEVSKELEPAATGPKIANFVAKMPLEIAKYIAAGPGAPLVMGIEGYGNTFLDAMRKTGGDVDKSEAAAAGSGAAGTALGLIPGFGPKAKSLTQLFFQKIARGFVLGPGMEVGNLASQWIYDPKGAKEAAKDPSTWVESIGKMLAYELAGGAHEIPEVRARASELANRGPAIEPNQPEPQVTPVRTPEASPNPEPARTRESVLEEAKQALASGDNEKALQLRREAKSLAPAPSGTGRIELDLPEMNTGDAKPTEPPTAPPEDLPNKLDKRFGIQEGLESQSDMIDALFQRREQLLTDIQSAQEQATKATRTRGPEGRRIARKTVEGLRNELADVEDRISQNTGKAPGELGLDTTNADNSTMPKQPSTDSTGSPTSTTPEAAPQQMGSDAISAADQTSEQIPPTSDHPSGEPNAGLGNPEYKGGDIADMFGLGSGLEATMNTLKRSLGLPIDAEPTEVASAVMDRIGHLGASVKETVVRIMSKIKGITRDVATAIAEHLHQAVSGSRDSQLGMARLRGNGSPEESLPLLGGPEEAAPTSEVETNEQKARKAAHRQEFADMLREFYPSDSPEDVAARHAAWSKYRYMEPAQAKAQEPIPAEPKATQEPYDRAKGFVKGITQPIRDLGGVAKAMSSGSNEATNRVVDELNRRKVLPKPYEKGSLEVPELVRPLIFNEEKPRVIKDLPRDVHGKGFVASFQHYMESPHNTEEPVFGAGKTPTQDAQMAIVSMVHNTNNMGKMFRDVLRTTNIEDNSAEMQAVAKPLFDKFVKAAAKLDPLQAQRDVLEKAVEKASEKLEEGEPEKRNTSQKAVEKAKSALDAWDAKNGDALKQARSEMSDINDAHQAMLHDFASKYGDARVALAAEYAPDKVPDWIKLSPDEQVAAAKFRAVMEAYKAEMKRLGIPWLEGGYVTHLTKYLADDTGSPQERRTPREVLSFAHREEGSSQWLPSVHAAVANYIPNASQKIAMQEFYNKWRPMIDPENMEGLSNPASPNYAPNASKYLTEMFKALDSPDAHDFIDKVFNGLRGFENAKLLTGSIRTAWKHFAGKVPHILAQNDVWTVPGQLGQVKALVGKLSADSPIRKAIDNLGGDTVDWAKKAQLVSYFANTREILGMLRENPFTSAVEEARRYGVGNAKTNKMFVKVFGNKAPDVLANVRHGIQTVSSNPVATMEAWENGLDLLSSIEKAHGHGMNPQESIPAFLSNMLDFNFRGGADSPLIVKAPKTRNMFQFIQTKMKGFEINAKLVRNAWNGGKDLYGTDNTANLVKHVVMMGIMRAALAKVGIDTTEEILSLPFVEGSQIGRLSRMAYYGTKMNILNDPDAARKFNEAKLAYIGSPRKTVVGSPVFDLARDVNTALTTGAAGLAKQTPIYSQIKAIATGKPPEGYDSVAAYLTGTPSEKSKESQEGKAVRAGVREERHQRKSEASR